MLSSIFLTCKSKITAIFVRPVGVKTSESGVRSSSCERSGRVAVPSACAPMDSSEDRIATGVNENGEQLGIVALSLRLAAVRAPAAPGL